MREHRHVSGLVVLLLSCMLSSVVVAQGTSNNNGGTTTNTTTAGAPANNASQPCVPSVNSKQGAIFIFSPNANNVQSFQSSAAVVGGSLNITWQYDAAANTLIPQSVSIYWVNVPSANALTPTAPITAASWYANPPIAQNLSGSTTSYLWQVPYLTPGNYQLEIVADGIDPNYYSLKNPGQSQCFKNGQSFPAQSTTFVISGNEQLPVYPDNWGPSNWGVKGAGVGMALLAGALVLAI